MIDTEIIKISSINQLPKNTHGPLSASEFAHTTIVGDVVYCVHRESPAPYDEYYICLMAENEETEDEE